MVTVPVPQREAEPAVGAVGRGLAVTATAADVTTHPFAAVTRTEQYHFRLQVQVVQL